MGGSKLFRDLDYRAYCKENNINKLFDIKLDEYGDPCSKKEKNIYESVDPDNTTPFPPELDDLIRLHYIVRNRKINTILEFGVGNSTLVFTDAIKKNKNDYGAYVSSNLRRTNPFEIHSVDNSIEWINHCRTIIPIDLINYVHFHFSEVEMTTFNGRICTMYKTLPNICPDMIYLDAPDQFNVTNEIRGISTAHPDRLPMSADILFIEPFLLPRTIIIVDGRTANARFLNNNFQRSWNYQHYTDEDIHIFELIEEPLGKLNRKQINFCLGEV